MAHGIVAFLISLAVGYWLFTLADKQSGFTKTLGQVLAWIIIVISLLGPVCIVTRAICSHVCGERGGYAMGNHWGGGWGHHGMGGSCMTDDQCQMNGKGGMANGMQCPMEGKGGRLMDRKGKGGK